MITIKDIKNVPVSICDIAYNLYKQDWINSHVTNEQHMDVLRQYSLYKYECNTHNMDIMTLEAWIAEHGYGTGDIYASYEEFCNNEYYEIPYMKLLLHDSMLISMYETDIKRLSEPKNKSKEIPEVKSLRWLANEFPFVENPIEDADKLCNVIHLYCTAGANKIEELQRIIDCRK